MGEGSCARCGETLEAGADGPYAYCGACREEFQRVREHGIVIRKSDRPTARSARYDVVVATGDGESRVLQMSGCLEAIRRAIQLADSTSSILFEYTDLGAVWFLPEYLESHPDLRRELDRHADTVDSLSRGVLRSVFSLFS